MTILDKFVLLFEGDSKGVESAMDEARREGRKTADELSKVDKAAQDMGKAIGTGLNKVGTIVDFSGIVNTRKELELVEKQTKAVDKAAYQMGESVGRGLARMATVVVGYLAVSNLTQSFNAAVHAADKLDESAERLGVSIETLSMWGDAAKQSGGSVEGLIGSVEAFNGALAAVEATGKSRALPFLKELGIDLEAVDNKGKDAFALLPKIAKAMEGMEVQKSAAIGRKLGLDAGTIMLLQKGGVGVEELLAKMKRLGVVTKEQGELAAKWNDQLEDNGHALRSLWLSVSTAVLPALTWLAQKFEDVTVFMRENADFIVGLMIAIGSAIAVFAIPPLISMGVAAVAALWPFLAIAAAVTALGVAFALVYDDVVNFMEGNDSLIGQFLEAFPEIASVLRNIGGLMGWLGETAASLGQIVWASFALVAKAIGDMIAGIAGFWMEKTSLIGEVFQSLGKLVSGVVTYWIDLISQFLDKFGGIVGIAKSIGGAISSALGSAKASLGITVDPVPRQSEPGRTGRMGAYGVPMEVPGLAQGKEQLSAAGSSPLAMQGAGAIRGAAPISRTTTVQIDKVEVTTQATDAAGISKSIGDTLGAQMRQAASNYDDGVAA